MHRMISYPNLPTQQWFTQYLVDRFNGDEQRWKRSLLRRLRRKIQTVSAGKRQNKSDEPKGKHDG